MRRPVLHEVPLGGEVDEARVVRLVPGLPAVAELDGDLHGGVEQLAAHYRETREGVLTFHRELD